MTKLFYSFSLVLLGEAIGAKETLNKENRYIHLSKSFRVLSSKKSDEEIWDFYQWRKRGYNNIRLFLSFIFGFFTIIAYVMSNSWIIAVSAGLVFLILYGAVSVIVKAERRYRSLWDDKATFMEFLKLNKSDLFDPIRFDQYLEFKKPKQLQYEPDFNELLLMLKNETNRFNSVGIERVLEFFDIMRENAQHPEELKCVQISDKDFISIMQARFVDNSNVRLDIELIKGDKSHIKALFYNFYVYSTKYNGEAKKGKAEGYSDLYLHSFRLFEQLDYTNFNDRLAWDFGQAIKSYNKMEKCTKVNRGVRSKKSTNSYLKGHAVL